MNRLMALALAVSAMLLGGCATTNLMSSSDEETVGGANWKTYGEAEQFYNKVELGRSTVADLAILGLDLKTAKNVVVLDRTSLLALFMASVPGSFDYLDPAVKQCLTPNIDCTPYIVSKNEAKEVGEGSLTLRVLGFKKESRIYGMEVTMLLLVHNDVVVYKQIKGPPNGTERYKVERKPLGPLDGVGVGGLIRR